MVVASLALLYLLVLLGPIWLLSKKYGLYRDELYLKFSLVYLLLSLLLLLILCPVGYEVDKASALNKLKNIFPDYEKHMYWGRHQDFLCVLVIKNIVFVWGLFIITKLKFLNKRYFKLSYFIATMIIFFASVAFHFIRC